MNDTGGWEEKDMMMMMVTHSHNDDMILIVCSKGVKGYVLYLGME